MPSEQRATPQFKQETSKMPGKRDDQVLQRIAKYEEQGRSAASERMQVDSPDAEHLEKQLDALVQQYETRLRAQKDELEQVGTIRKF
jgi:hypothetical protein